MKMKGVIPVDVFFLYLQLTRLRKMIRHLLPVRQTRTCSIMRRPFSSGSNDKPPATPWTEPLQEERQPRHPGSQPGPLPLGNPQHQAEFQRLIRDNAKQEALDVAQGKKHPDAPTPVGKEDKNGSDQWEGNKNPETGEIGGPKGKEPTR